MPLRRNMNINDVYEQEFKQRVKARMEERLDQFVDQLADRMNDIMNPRRRGDHNGRGSEGEESENLFFDGDGSSSDEQSDRPRRNQREDNRRWEKNRDSGSGLKCVKLVVKTNWSLTVDWSCDNLIAEEAVQKLGLKTENRPKHYKLQWLKKGTEVTISMCVLVTFSVGTTYKDSVWCDMVPMDTYHLLLGRPWEYDRNTTHNGRANTYSFLFGGVKITLMPNKPKELVNKPTSTLLTLSQFKDELEMGDEVHRAVHNNLVRGNSKYKQDADQVDFEVGDFIWAVLTKDRFPVGEYNKLSTKKNGLLEIIEKIDSNAYRLKLPSHIRCSDVFNVKHLLPYHGDSSNDDLVVNSRANFVYPGGMMQAQLPTISRFEPWSEENAVESGMRVNISEFDGNTLNPEGFIDWLVAVEEVFEFKEVPENKKETDDQLVSRYIGGLRVQIMDSVNMFDPVTFSDAYQRALAFEKQSRRVGISSSPAIPGGGSGSSNVASHFVPNQAKPGGGSGLKCFNCGETGHRQSECKKAGKRTLFAEPEEWEDDGVANDDYKEALVFDDDQYEEEVVTGDVGVNLMVRRSCLTPQAVGDDWLKHNIF
ncbi:reverse transcriptase domain-containing protein [Tanacetum coccineum]